VEQAQAALTQAEESAETALRRATDDASRRLTAAEEAHEMELRRVRNEFAEQLAQERATIADLTEAQAKFEPLLAAALNDADTRSAEIEAAVARADALEQRWKDAEQARDQAAARADTTIRERDTLALELEAARKTGQADAEALARAKQARQEAEEKTEAANKERDAALRDLKAAKKGSQSDADALARAKQAHQEAEAKAEAAYKERDAALRDLKAARKMSLTETSALEAAERARDEAEARAETAMLERDALAQELRAAAQASRDENAAASARTDALDAEHARLMRDWQADVVRLEVAVRERDVIAAERDAMAAELDSLRQSGGTTQAEERARQQAFYDAAEQRIRELELQLMQPQFEVEDESANPDSTPAPPQAVIMPPPAAVHDTPRRASRQAFDKEIQIQIDGGATLLVDLSMTGAQVISPTALKPNRMVKVSLPMGDSAVACRGKIVWARLEPPSAGRALCYRAGVLFTTVDESAIQSFITHHISKR
jgi:hypothetical protein